MAGNPYYPQKFIHLRLEVLYTAEHIVLELEKMGLFAEDWPAHEVVNRRQRAILAIRSYLGNNLPDKSDAHIPVELHRKRPAYLGARIFAETYAKYYTNENLDKFQEACRLTKAVEANSKLIEAIYQPAFSPEEYLTVLSELNTKHLAATVKSDDLARKEEEPASSSVIPDTSPSDSNQNTLEKNSGEIEVQSDTPINHEESNADEMVAEGSSKISTNDKADDLPEEATRVVPIKWRRPILITLSAVTMTAVLVACYVQGWFQELPKIRREQGARASIELLEQHIRPSDQAEAIIQQLKDEKALFRYARNALSMGKVNHAYAIFEHILRTTNDDMLALFTRFSLAEAILYKGEFEASRELLRQVDSEIQETTYYWYRAEVLQLIALSHLFSGSDSGIEQALEVIEEAESFVAHLPDDVLKTMPSPLASTLRVKGIAMMLQNDYNAAIPYFQESGKQLLEAKDHWRYTFTLLHLAFAYHLQGQWKSSRATIREAEDFIIPNKEYQLYAYLNVMRRHIDWCEGVEVALTIEQPNRHYLQNGDKLPMIIWEAFSSFPCPERKE